MDKKISVITICKNAGSGLEQTIESVLAQISRPYEYIIVDGDSEDETTVEIINKYSEKVDVILRESDKGISDALNKGIARATGEYILSVNAGDVLDNDCVKNLEEKIDGKKDVYRCHQTIKNIDNGRTHVRYPSCNYPRIPFGFHSCHMGTVIRREAFLKYGGYDISYKIAMDEELLFRFHKLGATEAELDINVGTFYSGGLSYRPGKEKIHEKLRIQGMVNATGVERMIYCVFLYLKALLKIVIMGKTNGNKAK